MGEWILGDLSRHPLTGDSQGKVGKEFRGWLGHALVAMPLEGHVALDYTGPLGSVMGIYYSLIFQLGKWEYNLQKADEWVEISPVHAQYYQLTHRQKEELEGKIKQGLVSVSQSVADMELLMHDKRRYQEFLHYMGYRTIKDAIKADKKGEEDHGHSEDSNIDLSELCMEEKDDKLKKRVDQHSLKAVFVDQVDVHTGEGISMRSIVSRWPTLITDFMNMSDEDLEIDKVTNKLKVSRAESVVLITKNKLYQEWKNIFGPEIKGRYTRINELLQARDTSVKQYKEWLKPYIARHKLIREGLSSPGGRGGKFTTPYESGGTATSSSEITLYVWKDFLVPEIFKGGTEETGKMLMEWEVKEGKEKYKMNSIPVDDEWTKRNFIFNKDMGLINAYPWITESWVRKQKDFMFKSRWLTPHKPYYSFFIIKLMRSTLRMPTGEEIDDGVFDVNMLVLSQNAMFCKLLEIRAKQEEMEQYVDGLLGVRKLPAGTKPKYADKDESFFDKFLGAMSLSFEFAKGGGPYERDFEDRITKIMLARCAQERYGPIVNFIKKKMGVGG